MEYLFCNFAIVWIVLNLPVPHTGSVGMTKLIVGLAGIILLVLVLLGHRVMT